MNPLLIIAIPLALVILGMILNSTGLSYDQPASSPEQDPIKKLGAEKEAYRKFFDLQRSRSLKRQKRVSQYSWLVMAAFIGAGILGYVVGLALMIRIYRADPEAGRSYWRFRDH